MLIVGLEGTELAAHERASLAAPAVSGVVLFTRNYVNRLQLQDLVASIRELRGEDFLLCVDHEGGPVQRFRTGFTRLPALARVGGVYQRNPKQAVEMAETHALVMAAELRACDIDMSLAPVLDLARGSRVIGERALHADPVVVAELGSAYVRGMHLAGMAATLKHFPGHGSIAEDTHLEAAIDRRPLDAIRAADLVPFAEAIASRAEAIVMAHVVYPEVDPLSAGYSKIWIGDVLRGELGFRGAVLSDDVGMAAAEVAGGIGARVCGHLDAGCDLVLVCAPEMVQPAIDSVRGRAPCDAELLAAMRGTIARDWDTLHSDPKHARNVMALATLFGASEGRA